MLADTHVHLLAGLDDGPATAEEAVAMARRLVADGAGFATALAHQNPDFPENDADRLRTAAAKLAEALLAENVPLTVCPTGEVMLMPETLEEFRAGKLLTYGDRGNYLLVEMPHGIFLDARSLAAELRKDGVRLVIAHAERYPELLHDDGLTEAFIAAGCLIQVTTGGLVNPWSSREEAALKNWVTRGMVHLLGSDGHGIDRRPPRLADGYRVLQKWAGTAAADRIARQWSTAVLRGEPVNPPPPLAKSKSWFARLTGG